MALRSTPPEPAGDCAVISGRAPEIRPRQNISSRPIRGCPPATAAGTTRTVEAQRGKPSAAPPYRSREIPDCRAFHECESASRGGARTPLPCRGGFSQSRDREDRLPWPLPLSGIRPVAAVLVTRLRDGRQRYLLMMDRDDAGVRVHAGCRYLQAGLAGAFDRAGYSG